MEFHKLVRELRGKRSLAMICKMAGLATPHLWQIEQGIIKSPTVDVIIKLMKAYPMHRTQILTSLGLV